MALKTTGVVHKTFESQQVTERFRKREFVVEMTDNPRYPQYVMFQLTGDRCELLDDFQVGDQVEIEFTLRGREWTSPKGDIKYFNSLDVWKLEQAGKGGKAADAPPPADEDDVPF